MTDAMHSPKTEPNALEYRLMVRDLSDEMRSAASSGERTLERVLADIAVEVRRTIPPSNRQPLLDLIAELGRAASSGERVTDAEAERANELYVGRGIDVSVSRGLRLVLEDFLDGRRKRSGRVASFAAPASPAERETFARRLEAFEPDPTGGGSPDGCEEHDEYSSECEGCTGHLVQADVDLVRRIAQTKEPELHRVADRLTARLAREAAERSEAIEGIRRPSHSAEADRG